jgi:IS30 family transposase
MAAKGRDGFPKPGEAHYSAKLTEADVYAIRAARKQGVAGAALARQYGVHRTTIYHLCRGDRWTHLKEAVS